MTRPSALKKLLTQQPKRGKRIDMPTEDLAATSEYPNQHGATTSPVSLDPAYNVVYGKGATHAPEIGEPDEGDETGRYAQSTAALLDKYLFSGKQIPFAIVLGIMGWIFIQDNSAGKLENWSSIWWTIQKCLFFIVLYVIWHAYRRIVRR